MRLLTFASVVIIFGLLAQAARAQDPGYWVKVSPPDESFSVLMPQNAEGKSQKNSYGALEVDATLYSVAENSAVYTVWSLKNRTYRKTQAVEDYLDDCAELVWESLLKPRRDRLAQGQVSEMDYQRELKAGGIAGREYLLKFGAKQGQVRFFADAEKIYVLTVFNVTPNDIGAMRFLSSFEPDRDRAAAQASQPDDAASRDKPLSLIAGPGRGGAYERGVADSAPAGAASDGNYDRVFMPKEVTEKARILSRAEPQYTESARKYRVVGTVVLEAVLSKTGEVTDVRVIKGLPHGLTRSSIESAKLMKFLPATKDGITVSQRILIEYNFDLY